MCSGNKDEAITIIIPAFNAEKTIADCIESVLSQTFDNWRLILVDDGSSDHSVEICQKYVEQDGRICLFKQKNAGAGAARNCGIDACQTRWLTFVDADDIIKPDYLANFKSPELCKGDISIQGYVRVRPDETPLGEKKNFTESYYPQDSISLAFTKEDLLDYGQTVGKLYETVVIKRNGLKFTSEFRLSEDHLFFLTALRYVNGIKMNSGTLYLYQDFGTGLNITHQSIPLKEALSRFRHIEQAADELKSYYSDLDLSSSRWLDNFVYTNGLSLVLQGAYHRGVSKHERLSTLKMLRSRDGKPLSRFNPQSMKGKVMKEILILMPIAIADYLLKIALYK